MTAVVSLTLVSALALFYLQLIVIVLSAVGGPPPAGTIYALPWYLYVPFFLVLYALVISIGQFVGFRWAWYASMALWIILLDIFGFLAYILDFGHDVVWADP